MKKLILSITLCALLGTAFAQQDPQFSQYMFNHLAINPAYAGSKDAMSFVASYRAQWVGFDGAPSTQSFAFHSPIKKNKMGVGINFINDKIGPTNMMGVFGSYAYRVKLAQGKLAFGLKSGVYNYRFDWDQITYRDAGDVYNQQGAISTWLPSFDFGMRFNTNTFFWGIAFTHLNRPSLGLGTGLPTDTIISTASLVGHATMTAGKAFVLSPKWTLRPSMIIRTVRETNPMGDINISAMYDNKIWFGISLRSRYGLVFITQFNIKSNFGIGYSYDMGLTRLNYTNSGSHEIYLTYDIGFKNRKVLSPRYF